VVEMKEEKIKMTLIQGDCLKVLPTIPDESVDLVLTDPPFMISTNIVIKRSNLKKSKYRRASDINYNFGKWDVFETKEEFLNFTSKWVNECSRLIKNGNFVSFFDNFKITYLIDLLEKNGFKIRQSLYWIKTNPTPKLRKVNFNSTVSTLIWASKGKNTFNYQEGYATQHFICKQIAPNNISELRRHPTQKPEKVIEWLIKYLSNENDTILDPFLGSGTTMKVARDLKRSCIGIEINPEYIEITKKRLGWGSSLSDKIEWEFKDMSDLNETK
jgi:site-specific DNA-methyltransferase (adenine-specific)